MDFKATASRGVLIAQFEEYFDDALTFRFHMLFKQLFNQPVAKPNRKCCVNRKVESGALKNFFLGSESVLLHSTLER